VSTFRMLRVNTCWAEHQACAQEQQRLTSHLATLPKPLLIDAGQHTKLFELYPCFPGTSSGISLIYDSGDSCS
jgi:hypothetical protein